MKGFGDMGTGTRAGDVMLTSDVDDRAVITGVCDVGMGTSGGDVMVVSDIDDVAVTTGVSDMEMGTKSGGMMVVSGVDKVQYDCDMTRCFSGIDNVAVMTDIADMTEMAEPDEVMGLVRAGDVDTIGTGGSETQGGEMPSGPPGWDVFLPLFPLLLPGGLRAIFSRLSQLSRVSMSA